MAKMTTVEPSTVVMCRPAKSDDGLDRGAQASAQRRTRSNDINRIPVHGDMRLLTENQAVTLEGNQKARAIIIDIRNDLCLNETL